MTRLPDPREPSRPPFAATLWSRRRFLVVAGAGIAMACTPEGQRPVLLDPPESEPASEQIGIDVEPVEDDAPIRRRRDDIDEVDLVDDDLERSIVAAGVVPLIEVFDEPDGAVTHEMANPTPTGGPLVFLTEANEADWHQVLLPVRPNGVTGWVRDDDVELSAHHFRIEVDLDDFRLRVFERGVVIFDAVAGVAAENSPTPGGRYYLTELLAPTVPDSVYGSFAYGLSGFSETFETFNGGPGQLGIHGTNDPDTLGSPVSSGCIRLHNDDIARLVTYLPLGVPVIVR